MFEGSLSWLLVIVTHNICDPPGFPAKWWWHGHACNDMAWHSTAEKTVDMIIIFDHEIGLAYFEQWTWLNNTGSNWLIRRLWWSLPPSFDMAQTWCFTHLCAILCGLTWLLFLHPPQAALFYLAQFVLMGQKKILVRHA